MREISPGVELIRFEKDPSDSEWFVAELAVNGTLATTFSVPTPTVWDYQRAPNGERQLFDYLTRQAINLIERYGDARNPRPDPALLEAN